MSSARGEKQTPTLEDRPPLRLYALYGTTRDRSCSTHFASESAPRALPGAAGGSREAGRSPLFGNASVIIGPPGTGKSSQIERLISTLIEQGVSADAIAAVCFTKAAVGVLRERLGGAFEDPRHSKVRTIHSFAFKLLKLHGHEPELMDDEAWAAFGREHDYSFSRLKCEDDDQEALGRTLPRRTPHDDLRYVVEWAASRQLDLDAGHRRCPVTVDGRDLRRPPTALPERVAQIVQRGGRNGDRRRVWRGSRRGARGARGGRGGGIRGGTGEDVDHGVLLGNTSRLGPGFANPVDGRCQALTRPVQGWCRGATPRSPTAPAVAPAGRPSPRPRWS